MQTFMYSLISPTSLLFAISWYAADYFKVKQYFLQYW